MNDDKGKGGFILVLALLAVVLIALLGTPGVFK